MPQSLSLWGATYNNVPSILLPKSTSGMAQFTDVTDTTAVAANVAEGTYFYTANGVRTEGTATGGAMAIVDTEDVHGGIIRTITAGVVIEGTKEITQNGVYDVSTYATANVNVSGGGGSIGSIIQDADGYLILSPDEDDGGVEFYDYDGTLLHYYTKSQFLALESMPANPDHTADGLTSQGWNWTLSDAQDYMEEFPHLTIGQMYIPTDGDSHFYFTTTEANEKVTLRFQTTGLSQLSDFTVDWGDGSEAYHPPTLSGRKEAEHIYSDIGDYEMVISCASGSWYFGSGSTSSSGDKRYSYFGNCDILTGAKIGSNLKYLPIFENSYNLEYVTLTDVDTHSDSNYLFSSCTKLKHVTIPSGITTFSNSYIFNDCTSLRSVSLPKSVTSINSSFLLHTYNIKHLDLPPNLTGFGGIGYTSLKSIYLPDSVSGSVTISNCEGLQRIENLKNTAITSLNVNFCYNLDISETQLPSTLTTMNMTGNRKLKSFSIPSTITSLYQNMFSGCYSLSGTITIPDGITTIASSMFGNCYNLDGVQIPSTVTAINTSAFSYCKSLRSITLPSNLTTIGNQAFEYCMFRSLTIPANVTSIGTYAFRYCCNMEEYHFLPTTPPTLANTNAFQEIPSDCKIYVPSASLSTYQSAENWSTYASYMVGE